MKYDITKRLIEVGNNLAYSTGRYEKRMYLENFYTLVARVEKLIDELEKEKNKTDEIAHRGVDAAMEAAKYKRAIYRAVELLVDEVHDGADRSN